MPGKKTRHWTAGQNPSYFFSKNMGEKSSKQDAVVPIEGIQSSQNTGKNLA